MTRKTGIIYAYDKSSLSANDKAMFRAIAPHIVCGKVGLEAFTATDLASRRSVDNLVAECWQKELSLDVFRDYKLADVANTVANAVHNVGAKGTKFLTLHASISDKALEAAVEAVAPYDMTLLAVTVLTDLDDYQCISRFGSSARTTAGRFAKNAYKRGIRGFVCSAHEASTIRESVPGEAIIVAPSIRPKWYVTPDEQSRITTPRQAVELGVDYIVVGRPISNPPPEMTAGEAAQMIREELDSI